jgi:hypothetical protein
LLEEYDIVLEHLETEEIEYLQTEVDNHDNKRLAKNFLNDSKYKHRPSALNRSELFDNAPKLNPIEKKEISAKSAAVKAHARRISTAADVYSFGNEIKAFRKLSVKIDEKSEREEIDLPTKKMTSRKSAIDPILKNGLKKNNFSKKLTTTNVSKNKKEDSNIIIN